ncbi:MAG: LysM peptidoglycan-binding domain-containing protein [bacterium]|nr:LysM peptidoglycan-binding domain-containing protein [bacterium]
MHLRNSVVVLCLMLSVFGCTSKLSKVPPTQTTPVPEPTNPVEGSTLQKEITVRDVYPGYDSYTEIVQILTKMDFDAEEYIRQDNYIAAQQVYEEALDLITEYEEDNEDNSKEYSDIVNRIRVSYREFLRQEGIEINETSMEILLDDIDLEKEDGVKEVPEPAYTPTSSFPFVLNSQVLKMIHHYQTKRHDVIQKYIQRSGLYLPMIKAKLKEKGMPEELAYMAMIESGYNPRAYSRAHAAGMWQFVTLTGRAYGLRKDAFIDERFNPFKATEAALNHLKDLHKNWDGDWLLAMANYNVSPRRMKRSIARDKTRDYWKLRSLPRETRNFVPSIFACIQIMKNPTAYGFTPSTAKALEFEEVIISRPASIDVIARAAGVSENEVKNLNPELRNWCTPLNRDEYRLKLPIGAKDRFMTEFPKVPKEQLVTFYQHRVRSGDTLSEIADWYGVSLSELKSINGVRNVKRLQIGQVLQIPNPKRNVGTLYATRNAAPVRTKIVPKDFDKRQKQEYKIRRGDTIWDISQAYGVSLNDLLKWNGLTRRSRIYPGQEVVVWMPQGNERTTPVPAVTPDNKPGPSGPVTALEPKETRTTKTDIDEFLHTVKRGETLSKIGKLYGVTLNDIYAWNNLNRRSVIYPGNKIKINMSVTIEESEDGNTSLVYYTVKKNDTLWDISRKYKTTVGAIKTANSLRTSRIDPGDILKIPVSANTYKSRSR